MGGSGVLGVEHVIVHAVDEAHDLSPVADLEAVEEPAPLPELHFHPGREIEARVGPEQTPATEQERGIGHHGV